MRFPTLKLGHQGALLVVLLLLLEIVFVQQYSVLLDQAEMDSRREEKTKEIITRGSDLLQEIYNAGDSLGKYALHHTQDEEQRYNQAVQRIPEIMSWLKNELRNNPEQTERLNRIDQNLTMGMAILKKMKAKADADPNYVIYFVQYVDLQPKLAALVRDMKAFLRTEREKESLLPETMRQQRERTKTVLLIGGSANVVLALFLAVFFVSRLRSRLNIVLDNSRRLREKRPLQPTMRGTDEIASIDVAFHKMVESLKGEEELLKRSEQQMRSMIENIPVGLAVLDKHSDIEFANSSSERILGYDQFDLLDKKLSSLLSTTIYAKDSDWISLLPSQQVVEVSGTRKDGSTVYVELSTVDASVSAGGTRVSGDTGNAGASPASAVPEQRRLAMLLDVSERHQMQKMRRAFVAMVSHELRTPLTSVGMFLEMLEMGLVGTQSNKLSAEIERNRMNVAQLILLITDLLDLEKTEADKLPLVPSATIAEDVIDKAIENVGKQLEEKNIRAHFEGSEVALLVDVEKLTKAMTNLLSGLIRLTPTGGLLKVDVQTDTSGFIDIKVNALNVNIPRSQSQFLFERFQQVEANGTHHSLGLGFALCQAIVKRHGGTTGIDQTDSDGGGTCLFIRLPRFD